MLSSQLQMLHSEDLSNTVEGDVSPDPFNSSHSELITGPEKQKNKSMAEDAASVLLSLSLNLTRVDFEDGGQNSLQRRDTEQVNSFHSEEITGLDKQKNEQSQNMIEGCSQDMSLAEDAASGPLSFSFNLSQIDFDDVGQNVLERKVKELIDTNKTLEDSLKHARKRCRELVKELRDERAKKIIRGNDFKIIHKILNKYI